MANGLTDKLKPREQAFVDAYIGLIAGVPKFNATAAARHAGYKDPAVQGWRLKQNEAILSRISEILSTHVLTPEETLAELADIATAEWRDFIHIKTNPRTGETIEVKMDLRSKVQALDLIGKHHKLFTDKVQHDGSEDFLAALRAFGGASGHSNT